MNTKTIDYEELQDGDKIMIAITVPETYIGDDACELFEDATYDLDCKGYKVEYMGIKRKQS